MRHVVYAAATVYSVALLTVKAHLFYRPRLWIMLRTPFLVKGPPNDSRHLLQCRMCVSVWVLPVYFVYLYGPSWLELIGQLSVVYAVAVFLVFQERKS